MLKWLGTLVDSNEKQIKRLQPIVDKINEFEPEYEKLGIANANSQADYIKEKIQDCISFLKEKFSDLVQKVDKTNTVIQSPAYAQNIEISLEGISDSRDVIKEILERLSGLKNDIQRVSQEDFEERWTKAITQTIEITDFIIEDLNRVFEFLDEASSNLSELSLYENNNTAEKVLNSQLGNVTLLKADIHKGKIEFIKAKFNLLLKESVYLLQKTNKVPMGSIANIERALRKFTLDALKAKTYEFNDLVINSIIEIQNELDGLELRKFKSPHTIKTMIARDNYIKSELFLEQATTKNELASVQNNLTEIQAKIRSIEGASKAENKAILQDQLKSIQEEVSRLTQNSVTIDLILKENEEVRILDYVKFIKVNQSDNLNSQALLKDSEEQLRRYQEALADAKKIQDRIESLNKDKNEKQDEVLNDLLPEAFAAVREAAKRTIGQRHFDVQLMGGMVLHQGKIAEMKTGEGKTLVATLPLYLNSLTGKGCHLVTVNDYLSKRDPKWMGPIYHALGVSVASIQGQQTAGAQGGVSFMYDPTFESEDKRWLSMRPITRNEAYLADIAYGTNNEFGFDYLRDNMVIDLKNCVQRELNYAIVDEVDNILIDEARTPLIISGPADKSTLQQYRITDGVVRQLKGKFVTDKEEMDAKREGVDIEEGFDYLVNDKSHSVKLTDAGVIKSQKKLNISDLHEFQLEWEHYVRQAITAHELYKKNRQYVVNYPPNNPNDGQVVIVDEFTGRMMFGRRYSDGLHQAIEAKEIGDGERVGVKEESMTYATITFQNYFRMYKKLAGMTGTAATEAEEFFKIYKLDVVGIPTNKPMIRHDFTDQVYKDEQAKFKAVVKEVEEMHKEGRPVLVGTVSVEKSDVLSDLFRGRGVVHQVLNAKNHEKEAGIIAEAGKRGAVTVATNMAGRGVDIILGGNPEGVNLQEWQKKHDEVVQLGGLHVIGTERHEARRIDNQLRGRSGRQGDPGSSRFYVSLEDDVMRRFGGDRIKTVMNWVGVGDDIPIENKLVASSLENAQVKVEGYHFDMRKHLVDYDDVVNTQREIIYGERRKILEGADLKANILSMVEEEIREIITARTDGEASPEELTGLLTEVGAIIPVTREFDAGSLTGLKPKEIEEKLVKHAESLYEQLEKALGVDNMRMLERLVMLRVIDEHWVQHLTDMDHMRAGVGLQAVAQRDPLAVYKNEGHAMFQSMMESIRHKVALTIFHVNIQRQPSQKQSTSPQSRPVAQPLSKQTVSPMAKVAAASRSNADVKQPAKVAGKKVGRNDPCPCGSGKKYKHCCGK